MTNKSVNDNQTSNTTEAPMAKAGKGSAVHRLFSYASRICMIGLVLGGIIVALGQVLGIVLINADLVIALGETGVNTICILASLGGIFAYLGLYTKAGREEVANMHEDDK
ncbi:hypothetical protein [Arthrobacter sp. NPDC056727]|uniref:hypothetical protein n=1 Tax=Arthrobacter sp. NPDC056727 TaxID=3345927 RepID=UPI003672A827